jgi:hypothetical protein
MHGSPNAIRRWFLVFAALASAAALLLLAVPRLQASLEFLPVDTAIKRYFREGEVPSAQLDALKARTRGAIAIHPHYRYHDALSLLNYLQAIDERGKPWLQRPALRRAVSAGLASTARAPAQPRTWLRIARARSVLGDDPAEIAAALELSILAGRVEPSLLLPRLELGYAHLDRLAPDTVDLLRDQTLLAWRVDERGFRRAVQAGRLDVSRVESVIGDRDLTIVEALRGNS